MTPVAASTFAALGEPSRLRIVELLRAGPRSVGDIVEALGIRQPQVSKHLRVLGDSGIVSARAAARRRIYHLEAEPFGAIGDWLGSFERVWESRLDSLGDLLGTLTAPAAARGAPADVEITTERTPERARENTTERTHHGDQTDQADC